MMLEIEIIISLWSITMYAMVKLRTIILQLNPINLDTTCSVACTCEDISNTNTKKKKKKRALLGTYTA